MKKYTFTYTKKELLECCIRTLWDTRCRRPAFFLILLFLFCIYTLILRRFPYEIFLLVAILYAVELGVIYNRRKKEQLPHEHSIWIENGLLKCTNVSVYHETPCDQINRIIKSKHLLMLGILQKKNQPAWFVIPTRVFSCAKEQYDFLEDLKRPVSAPVETVSEPEDFHFSFFMDIDGWVQIETEAWAAFRDKDCHNPKMVLAQILYYIALFFLSVWFLYRIGVGSIFAAVAMICFIGLLPLRRRMSPEKNIRKNLRNSAAQSNLLGNWDIGFTTSGISYSILGKRKVFMPWTEFAWMAETEHAFYFMRKDSRQFIPIPKSCLLNREQAQAWIQYCQSKGMILIPIKKPVYIPSWLFYVLFAFILCLFLAAGVWHGLQNAKPVLHDPSTLETQVATLRALGLTLSDETVAEIARTGFPDEETVRELIESYPYTWLLTSAGMPEYNDDFEITGYSKEVFWFDFEGWDLETDYIHVLEGMAALAEGSALDQVENIRVDTKDVNWEEGTGTLTVLFDYNGETLMYPMKVYYDWLDADVLEIYNDLLEHTDSEERFYAMDDDGQGVILFFCNDDWADLFEATTHIPLEKP